VQELGQQHDCLIGAAPSPSYAAIRLAAFNDHRTSILGMTNQGHLCPMKRASAIG